MRFMNDEVRHMRLDTANRLMSIFGVTFTLSQFDNGQTVRVTGPGIPFLTSGTAEWGDDWTAAGAAFQRLIDLNLIPEVVYDNLIRTYEE